MRVGEAVPEVVAAQQRLETRPDVGIRVVLANDCDLVDCACAVAEVGSEGSPDVLPEAL